MMQKVFLFLGTVLIFLTENDVRKLNVPANTVVSLTLWDIPGREDMDIHKSYFRNLDAAIGKFLLEISTAQHCLVHGIQ